MRWTQSKETNRVLEDAVESGWRIERTNSNHLRATSARGSVVFVASTPSDRRAVLNTRSRIKRINQQEQQL
jgi:hypothetical protein